MMTRSQHLSDLHLRPCVPYCACKAEDASDAFLPTATRPSYVFISSAAASALSSPVTVSSTPGHLVYPVLALATVTIDPPTLGFPSLYNPDKLTSIFTATTSELTTSELTSWPADVGEMSRFVIYSK